MAGGEAVKPFSTPSLVIPDGAERRSGIHSGAYPKEVPEWVPGLPTVARDDHEKFET